MAETETATAPAEQAPVARGAKTVTVACKLQTGLHAELRHKTADGYGGVHSRVLFRGSAAQRRLERADDRGVPMDMEPLSSVVGGYGLTPNVDAEWWEAWLEQNREYPPVKAGLIFAYAKPADAAARGRERAELRSGYEPLNPFKPAKDIKPDERHIANVT